MTLRKQRDRHVSKSLRILRLRLWYCRGSLPYATRKTVGYAVCQAYHPCHEKSSAFVNCCSTPILVTCRHTAFLRRLTI